MFFLIGFFHFSFIFNHMQLQPVLHIDSAAGTAKALQRAGQLVPGARASLARRPVVRIEAPDLTSDQEEAFSPIGSALNLANADRREPAQSSMLPRIFLLRGVTGSGKTEIYLAAVDHALGLGLRSIVLVPEIALTPQTVRRFRAHFGDRVAVLHSRMSPGERLDAWTRIRDGDRILVDADRGEGRILERAPE